MADYERFKTHLAHPLEGCWAKLDRAGELFRQFEGEIASVLAQYVVLNEDQPSRGRHAFWLSGPEISLRISVIAGEIIHHCRSVLDHMIWASVEINGHSPGHNTTFPICDSRENFDKAIARRALRGASKEIFAFVEGYQPFRSDDVPNHTLKILQDLDNRDKHRLLLVTAVGMQPGLEVTIAPDKPGFSIHLKPAVPGANMFHRTIEDGVEVQWIKYTGPEGGRFNIQCDFGKEIVFPAIGARNQQPVVFVLKYILEIVRKIVTECERVIKK